MLIRLLPFPSIRKALAASELQGLFGIFRLHDHQRLQDPCTSRSRIRTLGCLLHLLQSTLKRPLHLLIHRLLSYQRCCLRACSSSLWSEASSCALIRSHVLFCLLVCHSCCSTTKEKTVSTSIAAPNGHQFIPIKP